MGSGGLATRTKVAIGAAVVVVLLGVLAFMYGLSGGLAGRGWGDGASSTGSSGATSTAGSLDSTGSSGVSGLEEGLADSISATSTLEGRETALPTERDYTKFAYVVDVKPEGDTYALTVDYFDLLARSDGKDYVRKSADEALVTGVMPINAVLEAVYVPMAAGVEIRYATGLGSTGGSTET
jgi:hypothetical protein